MKRQVWNRAAKLLGVMAIAAVAASLVVGQVREAEAARRDQAGVARMTQKMKTVCIGRFLIDLPEEARFILGDTHYNASQVRQLCEGQKRILVASGHGPYPHTDAGVEVRRIFHELRSRAIENFNGQFKSIFGGNAQVPTKGLANTARFALGADFVYQLALLYQHEHGRDLRVGLKAFLKAA